MRKKKYFWTPEMEAILVEKYADAMNSELAVELGVPREAVCVKASRMKLRKSESALSKVQGLNVRNRWADYTPTVHADRKCRTCEEVKPIKAYTLSEGRYPKKDCNVCIAAKRRANRIQCAEEVATEATMLSWERKVTLRFSGGGFHFGRSGEVVGHYVRADYRDVLADVLHVRNAP